MKFLCLVGLLGAVLDPCSAFVVPTGTTTTATTRTSVLKKHALFVSASTAEKSVLGSKAASSKEKPETASTSSQRSPTPTTRPTTSSNNQVRLDENYPNFPRTWVPLGSTLELEPKRPNRLEFLENSYVAFQSHNDDNSWIVMDNTCPHRLAPLSEGRIEPETGRLQCSYHGWTFEADGSCQIIPQAVPAVQQAALQNLRSCVASYSTYLDPETGMLWMWPWKEDPLQFAADIWRHPEGIMGKHERQAPSANQTVTSSSGTVTYSREVPYGWDTLVENLIDPSHIPFAHHGMQGNRKDAIPINMTRATDRGAAGFAFEWEDRTMGMKRRGKGEFIAPYLVTYDAMFEAQDEDSPPSPFMLSVLCIPTKPGWSRVVTFTTPPPAEEETKQDEKESPEGNTVAQQKKQKKGAKTSVMRTLLKLLPLWVTHLFSNKFFDSDLAFLHYQEQSRQSRNVKRGDYAYFMPAESDRSIVALYEWMQKYASSYTKNQSSQLPPALYDRSHLFDRWSQHTSQCKVCLQALEGIKRWRKASQLVLAGSILLGFRYWFPRFVAVACLGTMKGLNKLEGAFYKGEFKHYENH